MAGGDVSYTLSVSAYSFGPLANLQVTDLLPVGFGCDAVADGSGYRNGTSVITYPNLAQDRPTQAALSTRR